MSKSLPAPLHAVALATALVLGACVPAARPASGPITAPAPAGEEELGSGPPIEVVEVRAVKRDILGGVSYDLPVVANSWVEAELDFLVNERGAVIGRWLERGDYYEGYVKSVLSAYGLPTDLYHLAMIESGFVPAARSRAGAVGMWQFMPATGKQMGLRVDSVVDERMDPVRSTHAAAQHLRWLYRTHGDWELAAAAYNAGTGRISRGLQAFGATSFWDLAQRGDLAEETRHYVPRLFAMTVIARNRERFGFSSRPGLESFAYDSIHVEYPTPLAELARMSDVPAERLARLNPHLLRGATPGDGYWVWTPAGTGERMQRAYLASEFRRQQGFGSYTIRSGDTLGRLAERSGVRAARIRELNPKVDFDRLKTGETLRLPYQAAERLAAHRAAPEPAKVAAAAPATKPASTARPAERSAARPAAAKAAPAPTTHTVAAGESLWGIARRYGLEVSEIQKANRLAGTTIRSGQKLTIPGGGRVAVAAKAPPVVEYVVQSGDSLWSIARRHGSSVDAIQSANELGERPIVPGQKLAIPQ
jgi:membrane-bound lytic murein transglycosylase D